MPCLAIPRQEKFCQLIASGKSDVASFAEAGYTFYKGQCYNLRHQPHIEARVLELMTKAANRAEITASRVLDEMAKLAFHNPADYLTINEDGTATVDLSRLDRNQSAAITEITSETRYDKEGNKIVTTKIKLADKTKPLDQLGRHLGLFVDRHEIGLAGDFTKITSNEELLEAVRRELGENDAQKFLELVAIKPQAPETQATP